MATVDGLSLLGPLCAFPQRPFLLGQMEAAVVQALLAQREQFFQTNGAAPQPPEGGQSFGAGQRLNGTDAHVSVRAFTDRDLIALDGPIYQEALQRAGSAVYEQPERRDEKTPLASGW